MTPRHVAFGSITVMMLAACARAPLTRAAPAARSFLAVTVSDLVASERWYDANLGARRVAFSRAPSGFAESSTVANDYLMVELIHFAAEAPSDTALRDVRAIGLQKAGVWVISAIFDSTLAHLRTMHASFVGSVFSDTVINARSFIVKDNSGTLIQFFTPLSHR